MTEFITAIRPAVELLYFVASILLVGGLLLAYRQLKLIKNDVRTRNQRAAAEKAIEACDRYFSDYIPLSEAHFQERVTAKLTWYAGPIGDFSYSSIPKDLLSDCTKRFALKSWLPALNRLESMAAYFTIGVADESTGFRVIGRTFCSAVETSYDLIALSRRERPHSYWSNTVELYALWRPRLTKAELDLAKQEVDGKISALHQRKIEPIGHVAG